MINVIEMKRVAQQFARMLNVVDSLEKRKEYNFIIIITFFYLEVSKQNAAHTNCHIHLEKPKLFM